jgi:hypothetical protein
VILDVLDLAGGFVLRAWAAPGRNVEFSHWLLLLTLLGALFLGLSKRRAEIVALAGDATTTRAVWRVQPYLLDQMIGVVTASTLLAYALYTQSATTVRQFGTDICCGPCRFRSTGFSDTFIWCISARAAGIRRNAVWKTGPFLSCVASGAPGHRDSLRSSALNDRHHV